MYRGLIVGAGRIGAGWNWHDDAYTHAGAYRALADRIVLCGFVETDKERADAAAKKWAQTSYPSLELALRKFQPEVVSICTQPDDQYAAIIACIKAGVRGIWCEKPYHGPRELMGVPVQVNYMRRGDEKHRQLANFDEPKTLIVYGKDDIHTRCHFEDLAKLWRAKLDYRSYTGPCAYLLKFDIFAGKVHWFDNGGVDGGACFKAMLGNLLDHLDNGTPLWSPAIEEKR